MENCFRSQGYMEIEENYLDEIVGFNPFLAQMYSNGSPKPQASEHERTKDDSSEQLMRRSVSWVSSHVQEIISSNPPPPPSLRLISFENLNTDHMDYSPANLEMASPASSQIINFSFSAKDDSCKKGCDDAANEMSHKRVPPTTRTRSQAQDHLMAERKRRENLSQHFISLSKVVPGLRKLDKASLLEDAINYLKSLQERVSALEGEEMKKSSMYVERSINNNVGSTNKSAVPEISARIAERHVLIKICCKKQMDLLSRIPCELEKINLNVVDMRMMPFGGEVLDVTILAEMQGEFGCTVKEIVDHLQASCYLSKKTIILNSGC